MSAEEPQFTITRKRKRQVPIDPCLGFYCNIISLSKAQSTTVVATDNDEDSDAADLPGWTSLPQDPPPQLSRDIMEHDTNTSEPSDFPSEPEPLTVETFLQRSALGRERIHVRKYGRRHGNRHVIQSDNEDAEDDGPNEQLNDSRSRPQVLNLFPIQKSKNDSVKPKPRSIRLWNTANAKGVPFRTSSFSEPTKKKTKFSTRGSTDAQCHPLSTWSTLRKPARRNESIQKISPIRKRSTRCAPLVFVPLADVDEAYNKKLHSARVTKREASHHGRKLQCPSVVPLILVPADNTENVPPNQSYLPSSPISSSADLLETDCISEPASEVPDAFPLTAIVPATQQASPACTQKTSSDKRLKPLGSFLKGFIERVRAATKAEDTITYHSDDQLSILEFVPSQESLVSSKPNTEHGPREALATAQDRTPRSSCSNAPRQSQRDQPLACTSSRGHPDSMHGTTTGVNNCQHNPLNMLDDTGFASQEFPPYVPPAAPFDINAALLAYTQAGNSCVQLCSFESPL